MTNSPRHAIIILFSLFILTLFLLGGCEGPQGPPGTGLGSLGDPAVMPEVIYTYPPSSGIGPFPELYSLQCGWEWCYYYSQFQLRFNKFMDVSSVRRSVRISSPVGDIYADTGSILSVGGDVFIINPVDSNGSRFGTGFKVGVTYTMEVDSTARDINGNALLPPFSMTFIPEPYFRVMNITPQDGDTTVGITPYINITFNSKVPRDILTHISLEPAAPGLWGMGYDSMSVSYGPDDYLPTSTRFTVSIDGDARDVDGNRLNDPFLSTFTTTGFRVSRTNPNPGGIDISLSQPVYVYFSLPLDTQSVRRSVHLTPGRPGTLYMYPGASYFGFSPDSEFIPSTLYRMRVDTTLKSVNGDHLRDPYEFSFTTAPFRINWTSPTDGEKNIPLSAGINIQTNAGLDPATVQGAFSIQPPVDMYFNPCATCTFIYCTPVSGYSPGTTYTVTIGSSLKTRSGVSLGAPYTFSFTTAQ
jgi:hypothetical protein